MQSNQASSQGIAQSSTIAAAAVQALASAANLAVYVYIWRQLDRLPVFLPLHYNGAGEVDLIGAPAELFRLPLIGTLSLTVNLVFGAYLHDDEPVTARFLIAATTIVELLLLGAAIGLVVRA